MPSKRAMGSACITLTLSIIFNLAPVTTRAASIDSIVISELNVYSETGDTVLQASLNDVVAITSAVRNTAIEQLDFLAIFDIRNEKNVSVNIIVHEGQIDVQQSETIEVDWNPDTEGTYTIREFIIANDPEAQMILSNVTIKSITVNKSDPVIIPRAAPTLDDTEDNGTQPPIENDTDSVKDENVLAPYTVMIYMVASDLESGNYAATNDILEMLEADTHPLVNVVLQTGGSANSTLDDTRFIDFTKVQRHELVGNEIKPIMDIGQRSMGDIYTLSSFIDWATTEYTAEKYAIIFWDHGNGIRGFGYDDIYGDSLTIREITDGLKGHDLEMIGFDGCLMATLEVASYLSQRANYLVASQEVEPEWGWDYEAILTSFNISDLSSFDGQQLGIIIADSYMKHSKEKANSEGFDSDRYLTLSVVDLSKIDILYRELEGFGGVLHRFMRDLGDAQTFARVVQNTERYGTDYDGNSGYSDLYEMSTKVGESYPDVKIIADRVKFAFEEAVVYNVRGEAQPSAHGLSIFMQLDYYESGQEYLAYLIPEWLQVIESGSKTLESDTEAPTGILEYSSAMVGGRISDSDVSYGSISFYKELEGSSKYEIVAYSELDASTFLDDKGRVKYELDETVSLCNDDKCVPVFTILEDYSDSAFAYFPVRLESDEDDYNEQVTLIYEIQDNEFIFMGAWEGFEDDTAQRGLRSLHDGDRIFTSTYEYDDNNQNYFREIENEAIVVTEDFGPNYSSLAGEYTFQMSVCDFTENCLYSEIFELV